MRIRQSGYDKQHRIDSPFNYAFLLGMSLFLWTGGYLASAGYPVHAGASATPLWSMVCRALPNKALTCLTGILLTAGGGFLIHRANYMLAIIREKTLMPFFLYILFTASNPDVFPLNPVSVGIFCLILAFYQLLTSYHDSGAVRNTFNAAFLIGLGSLFWVYSLWFLPVFWWGMYHLKVMSFRTFLASATGVGVIYWLLAGWCVWKSDYAAISLPFLPLLKPSLSGADHLRLADWVYVLYTAILTLVAIVNILLHEYEDSLRARRFLSFLIVFFVASFSLSFFYQQSSGEFLGVVCMPASILLSHFFTVKTGKKVHALYWALIFFFLVLSLMRSPWISLLNTVI